MIWPRCVLIDDPVDWRHEWLWYCDSRGLKWILKPSGSFSFSVVVVANKKIYHLLYALKSWISSPSSLLWLYLCVCYCWGWRYRVGFLPNHYSPIRPQRFDNQMTYAQPLTHVNNLCRWWTCEARVPAPSFPRRLKRLRALWKIMHVPFANKIFHL